jgi:hypothetical protein
LLILPAAAQPQSPVSLPDAPVPRAALDAPLTFLGQTAPAQLDAQNLPAEALPELDTGDNLGFPQNPPAKPAPGAAGWVDHASFQKRKWAQYVDPGEHAPRLYARDKWVFWLHEEARLSSPLPALVSAGYGQLTDDDPKYATDSGGFGDRVAAALVRQATMRFFSSSFFPVFYGEDPRYYRRASGSYPGRALWAVERVLVTQRDSGDHSVNGSLIAGHLAASALTLAYYPHDSRNSGVVLRTWGFSLAGAAGNNMFLEFWPDVMNLWHRHRAGRHASASGKR